MAAERLELARLHAAGGDHALAYDVAAMFDHPQPVAFLAALPESLRIRIRAAEALGWRDEVASLRQRLEGLSRGATAPPSTADAASSTPDQEAP
jgi:hypothetical protein